MESLDLISSLVYFLNIGFFCAIVSRFTGANVTVLILASLLYIGGKPFETVGIMATYLVFMRLTMYTQGNRLNYKTFQIFKGWRIIAAALLVILCVLIYPFAGLAIFLACFIAELLLRMYREADHTKLLPVPQLASYAAIAAVIMTAGMFATKFIPENYYYGLAGFFIFALAAFFWWIGENRRRLASVWDGIILASFLPAGLFGIDLSDWLADMRRTGGSSKLAANMPFIFLPAFYLTFIAANIFFGVFSFAGLILTFFSAIGIRLFGYYEMSGRGKANLVSLAVIILAAVCLFLTAPEPTGISSAIDAFLPSTPVKDLFAPLDI